MTSVPSAESIFEALENRHRTLLLSELSGIAELAQMQTSATGVIIAVRKGNELVVRTSNGVAPEVGTRIPCPSGTSGLCVTTAKPQTCASTDAKAQLEAAFRTLSVRSVLCVPVLWYGEVYGVLAVLSQRPEAFNDSHVASLMGLRDETADKLCQCERLCELPPQPAPVSDQVADVDMDWLPKPPEPEAIVIKAESPALKPEPVKVAAKAAAPVPHKTEVVAAHPAVPAASPRVELAPAAPVKYASPQKATPIISPPVRATAPALESRSPMFGVYNAPAKSRGNTALAFAVAVVLVALGLGVAFYSWHKSPPPEATANLAAQEVTAPAPASPASTSQPLPATQQPLAATSAKLPAPPAAVTKREEAKPVAQAARKLTAENPAHQAPVIQLATAQPGGKPEESMAPPFVSVAAASGNALPDFTTVSLPAARLAVRQSALLPARLRQGKAPLYPESAKRLGVSGVVTLHVSISASGKVADVRVLTGHPLLGQASINAVREWLYTPAYLDGNPVASATDVSLRFNPPR